MDANRPKGGRAGGADKSAPFAPTTHPGAKPITRLHSRPMMVGGILFLLLIFGVPLGQVGYELAHGAPVQALDYLRPFFAPRGGRDVARWMRDLGADLTEAQRLRAFEHELHEVSFVKNAVLPWYQWLLTRLFRQGTKDVAVGRDGWLFYGDDLESAYGPGFLEPGVGGLDALDAIEDFRRQLDERGVKLLVIPSYSKEMLDPDRVSWATRDLAAAANPDLERFYAELQRRGVDFVRMDRIFSELRGGAATAERTLGLPRDTHWTPATMEFAAARIAGRVRALLGELDSGPPQLLERRPRKIEAGGDLLRMLGLPAGQALYPPMTLELREVVWKATGEPVEPDTTSEVVLLGDSLTNVFSSESQGMGRAAGLAEQIAYDLDRPLDVIALDGKSATGVREALARRPQGLAGKRVVIWQFGVRMLAMGPGEWRKVRLPEPGGQPLEVLGEVAPPVTVIGTLTKATRIDPAKWDYPFCLGVMAYHVDEVLKGKVDGDTVWVAFPILDQHRATPANSFPIGVRHRLDLDDVRLHYDLEKVSWGDDTGAGRFIYFPRAWEAAPK